MKTYHLLLLLLLTSCGASEIYVKQPIPFGRVNLKSFNSDLRGEYDVTDTVINDYFYEPYNELYNPKIILQSDTSIFITCRIKVIISENMVVSKKILTGHLYKDFYDNSDKRDSNFIDSVIFMHDTVKLISIELIDTLFNFQNKDILRKYKGDYLLNNFEYENYIPSILKCEKDNSIKILHFERSDIVHYYMSSFNRKKNEKAKMIEEGNSIKIKNSELNLFIKNDYFKTIHSLKKI